MNEVNKSIYDPNILLVCVYAKDIINEKGISFIKSAKSMDEAKNIVFNDNKIKNRGHLNSDGKEEGYFIMEYDMSLFNKNSIKSNNLMAVYNGNGVKIK